MSDNLIVEKIMKIFKKENKNFYTLSFTDKDGHNYYVDPFKTFNDAYEHYVKFFLKQDDLK